MLQSQLFTKTAKIAPQDEPSLNAKLLMQAGFIDKLMAGVYTLLPLGFLVIKKIEKIIREEIEAIGGQEVYLPALHPIENYQKTKRDKIDVLLETELHGGTKLFLGQSHEEIIAPLLKKFVFSYKDLPRSVFQFQTKFRNELRAKSGILRGREFMMKDLYSFHASEDDLNEYYKLVQKAYFRIFERVGILDKTYLTFASGGTFSKYSHEFQTICSAGEDIIYICEKCSLAINKELIHEQKTCPNCDNADLKEEKSIEVGNIFKQGTRFTEPFDLSFIDNAGKKEFVNMGAYGIGLGRLMGTVVESYNDESGIIWPKSIAPFQVHLVGLKIEENKVAEKAQEIYDLLKNNGFDCLYDDRKDVSAGQKFADADLIGCPFRILISEKSLNQNSLEIKKRATGEVDFVKIDKIIEYLNND